MGAGILPITWHNGRLYFLFGKEGKYEDSAPGFSDFGGGTDAHESFLTTAVREAGEELTGFLGSSRDVRRLLTHTYNIDHDSPGYDTYRVHLVPLAYNPWLPHFYNNNQRFLQRHLPARVFRTTKIFEKAEIRWVCIDDLPRMRPQFRSYFRHIVDRLVQEQHQIRAFLRTHPTQRPTKHSRRTRTHSRRTRSQKKNLS